MVLAQSGCCFASKKSKLTEISILLVLELEVSKVTMLKVTQKIENLEVIARHTKIKPLKAIALYALAMSRVLVLWQCLKF